MFVTHAEDGYSSPVQGIEMKPLSYGEKTLLVRFKLSKGAMLPAHSHPHEQTGYLVSGRIVLNIDGEPHEAVPGDSWTIPKDIRHGAQILEDSVAVEVFSPVREDYLPT
jgi:quercetin dioxygenase-like cupin family protein